MIAAVAAGPRLVGLRHVSLGLDEILETLQVGHGYSAAWAALREDSVHPPLWGMLDATWLHVIDTELARRLLPILFGVATVALLSQWAARTFGRRIGLATGLLAAVSPLHVRYSQEIRPYSLGILAVVLAILAGESLARTRTASALVATAIALALCFWSLYVAAAVVPVLLAMSLSGQKVWRWKAAGVSAVVGATFVAALAFSPWLSVLAHAVGRHHELPATRWTWPLFLERWSTLTVSGVEGESPRIVLASLFALLVVVGAWRALKYPVGPAVLTGAVAGTLGVEAGLSAAGHWSNARYDLAAWPFLILLAANGAEVLGSVVPRASPRPLGAWMGAFGLAIPPLLSLSGLLAYYERGRPDWEGVAAVALSASSGEPILAGTEWVRVCLGYYVARRIPEQGPQISSTVVLAGEIEQVRREVPRGGCRVLVDGGWELTHALNPLFESTPAEAVFPRTHARLAVLAYESFADPLSAAPWSCSSASLPLAGERISPLDHWTSEQRAPRRLEMVAAEKDNLGAGWSYPESTPQGVTFRWMAGHWARFRVEAGAGERVAVRMWPLATPQSVALFRGGVLLGESSLDDGPQVLEWTVPPDESGAGADFWIRAQSAEARGDASRSLAIAVDGITVKPKDVAFGRPTDPRSTASSRVEVAAIASH